MKILRKHQKENTRHQKHHHRSGDAFDGVFSRMDMAEERISELEDMSKKKLPENQDGGVGRHTAPPRTTRIDRESNSKGDQHQENRK